MLIFRVVQIDLLNFQRFVRYNLKYLKLSDGSRSVPNHQLCKIFEPNDFHWKRGMLGCALSHLKLWIDLLEDKKSDAYIVLEDDVTFANKFSAKLDHVKIYLEGRNWDITFLGHSPYIENPKNKLDTLPMVELWSRSKSKALSMGGTFGYMISKKGAKKVLDNISKVGITNGIDWMMFLPDNMCNYYCTPHIVFSECFRGQKTDSDIQCNPNMLVPLYTDQHDLLKMELEYWMGKTNSSGVQNASEAENDDTNFRVNIVKESKVVVSKIYKEETRKIVCTPDEKAKGIKNWYSAGGYYFVIPE